MNLCISLFDFTGNWSRPYAEAGWHVIRIDIKDGIDLYDWRYLKIDLKRYDKIVLLMAMPCTCYALSGNRHKEGRRLTGEFEEAQILVDHVRKIFNYFDNSRKLIAWALENPKTDIHTHNAWLQSVSFRFNPCDFAGYLKKPDSDRYNKETWLFGEFNLPETKYLPAFSKASPMHSKMGGKSERTKELRSITPLGFAYAFFKFNN